MTQLDLGRSHSKGFTCTSDFPYCPSNPWLTFFAHDTPHNQFLVARCSRISLTVSQFGPSKKPIAAIEILDCTFRRLSM